MRNLITTTALAMILAAPVTAQTTEGQQDTQAGQQIGGDAGMDRAQQGAMQPGDLLASELMDAPIYAPPQGQQDQQMQEGQQAEQDQQLQQDQQMQQGQQQAGRWGEPMGATELEGLENIGNVGDLLLDEQGTVQAVLVDVGGFLGMGARQVAIGLDQLSFVTDIDDPSQVYVLTSMGADMLENAPEFDQTAQQERGMQQDGMQQEGALQQDTQAQDGMQQEGALQQDTQQQDQWRADREGLAPPDVQREGFQPAQADEISADDILNANLYDVNDDNVGNVSDVVLGPEGEAQYLVADVGGFLGIGAHTVAIGFDELTIMRDDGMGADLRIYVDVTEDSLRAMPEYAGN